MDFSAPCSRQLDDLFPSQNMEVDVSLEWLSVFVEDCFSSTGNCLPPPAAAPTSHVQDIAKNSTPSPPPKPPKPFQQKPHFKNATYLGKFVVPAKARSKRKRVQSTQIRNPLTSWSYYNHQTFHFASSDPPLLQQAYWLADSELIKPKKEEKINNNNKEKMMMVNKLTTKGGEEVMNNVVEKINEEMIMGSLENNNNGSGGGGQAPRRCTHCLAQRTPQWRAGPLGPKTLCNACGVRYKSGRLLPEYRPAKSPTFVSYLHSNSHKKVLEMRNCNNTMPPSATTAG